MSGVVAFAGASGVLVVRACVASVVSSAIYAYRHGLNVSLMVLKKEIELKLTFMIR
jgi:uncharacterized membrane protein